MAIWGCSHEVTSSRLETLISEKDSSREKKLSYQKVPSVSLHVIKVDGCKKKSGKENKEKRGHKGGKETE